MARGAAGSGWPIRRFAIRLDGCWIRDQGEGTASLYTTVWKGFPEIELDPASQIVSP